MMTNTSSPADTGNPCGGSVSIICPASTVAEGSRRSPTRNPWLIRVWKAWPWVWSRTSGTKICPGPVETVIVTASPSASSVPEAGSWKTTVPASAWLGPSMTMTWKPAFCSMSSASTRLRPLMGGTVGVSPWLTVNATVPASAILWPAGGRWANTVFSGHSVLT